MMSRAIPTDRNASFTASLRQAASSGTRGGLFELGAEPDEDVFAPVRGDELHTTGHPVVGPAERQRQRRLTGHVDHA